MMFWYGHDMGWWGYAGVGVGMVLFWALVIIGIVALIRYISGGQQPPRSLPHERSSADQILAERFARGEISETEYRDRLAVLRGDQTTTNR